MRRKRRGTQRRERRVRAGTEENGEENWKEGRGERGRGTIIAAKKRNRNSKIKERRILIGRVNGVADTQVKMMIMKWSRKRRKRKKMLSTTWT